MEMIALNNGSTEPQPAVVATFMSLSGLWKEGIGGMCAVVDLVERCKNPQHPIDRVSEAKLKSLALIGPDGRIHQTVKNVTLSAAKGESFDMTLVSPVKPSEADLALKAKVEKTIDNLLGAHMAMMQLVPTLSREQIEAFCDNTRNGSDLWDDFKVARDASGNENFGFSDYARQVLSTTAHPMS
jgi:hypothetical protein